MTQDELNVWGKAGVALAGIFLWFWKSVLSPIQGVKDEIKSMREAHETHLKNYTEQVRELKRNDEQQESQNREIINRLGNIEGYLKK